MSGRFITFEGGDGAGKTTQIRRLAERLSAAGRVVVTTREPGGTPKAEAIRELILSGRARALGADGEAILFAAARTDHVEAVIRPALARGDWVLCDRFLDSTRVYQGVVDGAEAGLLRALERIAIGDTRPDLTIILDLPAEVGLARTRARRSGGGDVPDRFEGEELEQYETRRRAFLDIAAREPKRCAVIDATKDKDEVAAAIWRTVQERLLDEAAA